MSIKHLRGKTEFFRTTGSDLVCNIAPYKITDKTIDQHVEILKSTSANTLDYKKEDMEPGCIINYVHKIQDNANEILLAIQHESELIGTSRVSILGSSNDQTVGSGILLHKDYRIGLNIEKVVKGMNSLRLTKSLGLEKVIGACNKYNIRSVAYYKYFGYSINSSCFLEKENQVDLDHLHFEITAQDLAFKYLKKLNIKLNGYGIDIGYSHSDDYRKIFDLEISINDFQV